MPRVRARRTGYGVRRPLEILPETVGGRCHRHLQLDFTTSSSPCWPAPLGLRRRAHRPAAGRPGRQGDLRGRAARPVLLRRGGGQRARLRHGHASSEQRRASWRWCRTAWPLSRCGSSHCSCMAESWQAQLREQVNAVGSAGRPRAEIPVRSVTHCAVHRSGPLGRDVVAAPSWSRGAHSALHLRGAGLITVAGSGSRRRHRDDRRWSLIVIDSKTLLDAFVGEYGDRPPRAGQHPRPARRPGSPPSGSLAAKAYWSSSTRLRSSSRMFLPGEAIFAQALDTDLMLMTTWYCKNVMIVTPTTLIGDAQDHRRRRGRRRPSPRTRRRSTALPPALRRLLPRVHTSTRWVAAAGAVGKENRSWAPGIRVFVQRPSAARSRRRGPSRSASTRSAKADVARHRSVAERRSESVIIGPSGHEQWTCPAVGE